MRNTLAVAFACALGMVSACAWGDGAPTDDDDDGQTTDDNTDDSQSDDSTPLPVCGDGTCASSELASCSADCGAAATCGDGTCGGGETQASCPSDCTPSAVCGDGTCNTAAGETPGSCPGDCSGGSGSCPADPNECLPCLLGLGACPPGLDETSCQECILGGGGGGGLGDIGCTGGAPDGTCDADEDADICASDCP